MRKLKALPTWPHSKVNASTVSGKALSLSTQGVPVLFGQNRAGAEILVQRWLQLVAKHRYREMRAMLAG